MGEVFLASSGGIDGAERPCVVKLIKKEHETDRSFLARFLDEARIQAQLQHPGVAQILEASTDAEDKPYVVVEYVEGRNLGEVRQRALQLGVRLGWADAVAIGIGLGEALAHMHERTGPDGKPLDIVHRDLSPQNVMVGYGGELKLIDFGTAKGENRRCHTVAGIVFAKPGYVAPEVANHTPGGVPADLYAFGVMLWELCAGRRFLVGDATEHMAGVAAGTKLLEPLAPSTSVPAALDDILARLTATAIGERYSRALDAVSALSQLLKSAPSLANGERSVRGRIAHVMQRLYPAEPARSRAEFARLVAEAKRAAPPRQHTPPASPEAPEVSVDDPMLPGTRYQIVRAIGHGAMSTVYEAVHVDLDRRVALKVLAIDQTGSSEAVRRFKDEIRAVASLRHPNVIDVQDAGVAADGRPYLAMELVPGEALDVRAARLGTLGWREVARIGIDVCDALGAAHAAGIVHRDVKPQNLLFTEEGRTKLLDFGVAALSGASHASGATEAVAVIGTPEYAAPEMAHGAPGDARSDLYSLGVVLFQLLTGALPVTGSSTVALLDAKSKQEPVGPARRAPERGIPKMMDHTVERSINPDSARRFENASEMRAALEAALREPEQRRARQRKIGYGLVALLAAGALSLAGFALAKPEVRSAVMMRLHGAPPPAAAPVAAPSDEGEIAADDSAPVGEVVAAAAPAEAPGNAAEPVGDPAAADDEGDGEEGEGTPEAQPAAAGDALAAAAPQAEPAAAAPSPEAAKDEAAKATDTDVEAKIAEAQALMVKGQRVKGFHALRKLGRNHRKDARVLKAWSEAAAQMKSWGEALRVARQWAAAEQSTEAQLHLARMQRAVGKPKEAVQTLAQILKTEPTNEDAKALMRLYEPPPRVALIKH